MPKVPKISLHFFIVSPEKHEIGFLPADKHKNFLQIDSISLFVHVQACLKYPKQQVYNIFAISQGKHKDEVDFCLLIWFTTNWYYDFDGDDQTFPKLPK